MRSKSRRNVGDSSTSQKLHAFQGFLVNLNRCCGPSLHIHISGRKKEKGRKAKVSDSQIKTVPLKMPRVPQGSFFPSLVTASFRGFSGQGQVQLNGSASLCSFWSSGGEGAVGTPEKPFLFPVS